MHVVNLMLNVNNSMSCVW